MGSVSLLPIDIPEETFEVEENIQFDPSKLDYDRSEKEKKLQGLWSKCLGEL